jgi:uridine kinase/Gpi18-like mannosyltransferase
MIQLKEKNGNHKLPILKSRLFWLGVLVKLVFSILFASDYLSELFAPFGNYFISSGFANPYEYFAQNGTGTEFPYPPLMLWLFSSFRALFWVLLPGGIDVFSLADSLLYRIPLFIADLSILFVLMRWLKTQTRQVLIWYWLSPVLIYINYFHGQLDVIPMAFLIGSLYFLFKNKWAYSFLILGFAIACKTNMVLVLPFFIIYLWRIPTIDFKKIITVMSIMISTVLLLNLPYISSADYVNMVYNNPVQQQVFDLFYQFNSNLKIYFIPAVYFVLVLWYFSFKFVNRDQLILFLAFTFLALTLMIAPMQGWYFWIMPLLIYFVIKHGKREQLVFVILSFLYFIYFGFIQHSDYFNSYNFATIDSPLFVYNETLLNIAFTLLQTTLLIMAYLLFKNGISSNIQAKFLSQPYMIGIGGDSAAGKSTLTNALASVFEIQNTTIIRGDDMHKWERGNENWKKFTHLDPRANHLHQDLDQAKSLKIGQTVKRSFYDHKTGKFTIPTFLKPNKLILFEGLHSFYLQNQLDVYDLKIFMQPQEDLRVWWKVKRDVAKRGYSPEQVLEQLKTREQDSEKYIKNQALHADIVASFYSENEINPVDLETEPRIGLKLRFTNGVGLDQIIEKLDQIDSLKVEHEFDNIHQYLILNGTISENDIELIAYQLIPQLEEIGVYNPKWKSDYEGLLQFLTVYFVFEKMKA